MQHSLREPHEILVFREASGAIRLPIALKGGNFDRSVKRSSRNSGAAITGRVLKQLWKNVILKNPRSGRLASRPDPWVARAMAVGYTLGQQPFKNFLCVIRLAPL